MILGIMQPYFFPYLEHFRLIAACDRWIVFDTAKFGRRTWMDRNRIISRTKPGWRYFKVPVVKGASEGPVAAARLSGGNWRATLDNHLRIYSEQAPFYADTRALVREVFAPEHETLADLNTWSLRAICRYLGIATRIDRLSELDIDLPDRAGAGEWAPIIAGQLGASEYRNASGGRALLDSARFEAAGVRLRFHEHRTAHYTTGSFMPIPDLSIIDPLMWRGRDAVSAWIHNRSRPEPGGSE